MWAASEISASDEVSTPTTTSTTMKPTISASATAEPAVVGVGRDRVVVMVVRVGGRHPDASLRPPEASAVGGAERQLVEQAADAEDALDHARCRARS